MISIISPVLNESKRIITFINSISSTEGNKEHIIVDGNSTDNSYEIASDYIKSHNITNTTIITSERGRSIQLNAGAAVAKGDILWFLHSDNTISENSLLEIKAAIDKGYGYGAFSLDFYDSKKLSMKLIAFGSNLRAKYTHLIFGDQALFIRKDFFEYAGRFPAVEFMEDYNFSQVLIKKINPFRRLHPTIKALPILLSARTGTSARRYLQNGIYHTFFLTQIVKFLYRLRISNHWLKNFYAKNCSKKTNTNTSEKQ